MELYIKIKELRQKKGWTVRDLEKECGVSKSMISKIENDPKTNYTMTVYKKIMDVYEKKMMG